MRPFLLCLAAVLLAAPSAAAFPEDDPSVFAKALGLRKTALVEQPEDDANALRLQEKALAIRQKVLGSSHPSTVTSSHNLAPLLWKLGRHADAVHHWQRMASATEVERFHRADTGFDRAQGGSRDSVHANLARGLAQMKQPRNAFRHLEASLARGMLDDLGALSRVEVERLAELRSRIVKNDSVLIALAPKDKLSDRDRQRLNEARKTSRDLSEELSKLLAESSSRQVLPLARIQKALPDDSALLSFLDLGDVSAVVIRNKGVPVWKTLPGSGKKGAWTEADTALADKLLRALRDPRSKDADRKQLLDAFRKQRLEPLAAELKGVRRLFVVPTSAFALVPAEVLTDACVSYAPSGSVLARLREDPRAIESPSLLVVGEPAGKDRPSGFRAEAEAIAALVKDSTLLLGSDASEQKLDNLIEKGKLKTYRIVHLAAPTSIDEVRVARSAVVLAKGDRLTVSRIRERWQLDADLVVLSGDESALGKDAHGDGLLGFVQAFMSRGARTVLISRWKVDRPATALLLLRFYENLLVGRNGKKPLSRIAALHEAKNWLRTLPKKEAERLATLHAAGVLRSSAGKEPLCDKMKPIALTGDSPFAHPYYWAAFTLVGDPD